MSLHSQSWQRELILTNNLTLSGYSRAAYRTGFVLKELGLFFDAGLSSFSEPKVVLISHGHSDHVFSLYAFSVGGKQPTIVCPQSCKESLINYISSISSASHLESLHVARRRIEKQHHFHGIENPDLFRLSLNAKGTVIYQVQPYILDHSVDTLGYGLSEVKKCLNPLISQICNGDKSKIGQLMRSLSKEKLRADLIGFKPDQIETLNKLRESNQLIIEKLEHKLVYLLDTTVTIYEKYPCLFSYQYILTECTFFADEDLIEARKKKHTHIQDLVGYITSHPETKFILTHFTLKNNDEQIVHCCMKQLPKVDNVCLWLEQGPFWLFKDILIP